MVIELQFHKEFLIFHSIKIKRNTHHLKKPTCKFLQLKKNFHVTFLNIGVYHFNFDRIGKRHLDKWLRDDDDITVIFLFLSLSRSSLDVVLAR